MMTEWKRGTGTIPATGGVGYRLLSAGLLFGAFAAAPLAGQEVRQESRDHAFRVVTVAEGLENPWGLAFLPEGGMLVTERPGRLRHISADGTLSEPIAGVPEVFARGQGGLLDIALHPDFEANRLLYLSFAKPKEEGALTAVIRARFEGSRLTEVEEIFEAQNWDRGGNHFGSRFAFDSEGYLFITISDRAVRPELGTGASHPAQDLSNHNGTIVRLHDDGRVPADNPFVGQAGARPEIWSYGHRSLQGLAIDRETGRLWQGEHGPQGGDEINLITPGANYGWPIIGHGVQYGGSVIHEGTERVGLESPVHVWVPSIATSGLAVYRGDAFPRWRGDLFVGALAGQQLARVTLDGTRSTGEERLLTDFGERIRDVREGPDGFLYLLTDNPSGRILRLEPDA